MVRLSIKAKGWLLIIIKSFFKKHYIDIIIISSLLISALAGVLYFQFAFNDTHNIAYIYHKNELLQEIDLNKETDLREFEIHGEHGLLTVGVKKDNIAILESSCLTHQCVKTGYISKANHSIVCAYNAIYIVLKNNDSDVDIEV